MLVEAPLGNILDADSCDVSVRAIDWLDLSWAQCASRAMRRQSRSGLEVRFLLGLGISLRHGDLLWQSDDGSSAVVVNVLPSEVLVATATTLEEAASIGFELGNLHAPMQFAAERIITLYDGPIQAVLDRLVVSYERQTRRFEPQFKGDGQFTLADNFELSRKR